VHPDKGFTNTNLQEAEIKRAMLEATTESYVLADHSKLMKVATARIGPLSAVTGLISDHQARAEDLELLQTSGLNINLA
jgi:DeoR family transcriptional regulator of aga operon